MLTIIKAREENRAPRNTRDISEVLGQSSIPRSLYMNILLISSFQLSSCVQMHFSSHDTKSLRSSFFLGLNMYTQVTLTCMTQGRFWTCSVSQLKCFPVLGTENSHKDSNHWDKMGVEAEQRFHFSKCYGLLHFCNPRRSHANGRCLVNKLQLSDFRNWFWFSTMHCSCKMSL